MLGSSTQGVKASTLDVNACEQGCDGVMPCVHCTRVYSCHSSQGRGGAHVLALRSRIWARGVRGRPSSKVSSVCAPSNSPSYLAPIFLPCHLLKDLPTPPHPIHTYYLHNIQPTRSLEAASVHTATPHPHLPPPHILPTRSLEAASVADVNGDVPLHFAAIHGHPMAAYRCEDDV